LDLSHIAESVAGLYGKYVVFNNEAEDLVGPLDGCFVLRPVTDPAARKALSAYAEAVHKENPEFASDLRQWLIDIGTEDGARGRPYDPWNEGIG
jgi:hypothetical protein